MADRLRLPKYRADSEMLIREIAAGHLADGARLPPEREMAASIGVRWHACARRLDDLETRVCWTACKGRAITSDTATCELSTRSFRLELSGRRFADGAGSSVDRLAKPTDAGIWRINGHRIRRLRVGRGCLALEEIWLDGACVTICGRDLSESLYLFYRDAWAVIARSRTGSVSSRAGLDAAHFDPVQVPLPAIIERISWSQTRRQSNFRALGLITTGRDTFARWDKEKTWKQLITV